MAGAGPIERALALAAAARRPTNPDQTSSPNQNRENLADSNQNETGAAASRQHHHVTTLLQWRNVIQWMVEEVARAGNKRIAAKATTRFPSLFTGNYKANHAKASLWKKRDDYLQLSESERRLGNIAAIARNGLKRINFKAMKVRGRKSSGWVTALYNELISEFDRLQALNIKLSPAFLVCVAKALIVDAGPESAFNEGIRIGGKPIMEKITVRWIQSFMEAHNLVIRHQSGNLSVSPPKLLFIEKTVAVHLGVLKRGFQSRELDENLVENADEAHFISNMDNGRTIGFRGQEKVKHADVVSGDEGIAMMVRITGGINARIEAPMLFFKNANSSYPIRGVVDDVPGVCYRLGPKGWMDGRVFKEWLSESRAISKDQLNRQRVLYVDNCSGHNENEEVEACLNTIKTVLCKLPAHATDMVQPADSFVIAKIKDAWRKRWDAYKVGLMARGEWMGSGAGASGKLKNPGKRFFLQMAADSVRDVNAQRDKDCIS